MFVVGEQPMIHSNQLDRQSAQVHRLVLLVAEVPIEEETVLDVFGFLVKRGRRWCCPLALWLRLSALGAFSLGLAGLEGIDTCLGASSLRRFASLLLQQARFHE